MTDSNSLPYYPRFIFNFSDDKCFSTGDLDEFEYIKEHKQDYKISRFVPGQKVDVTFVNENNESEVGTYSVNRIEIHQIKYDLDEPTYGFNMNDCTSIFGKEKKWLMEIYVYLDLVE